MMPEKIDSLPLIFAEKSSHFVEQAAFVEQTSELHMPFSLYSC